MKKKLVIFATASIALHLICLLFGSRGDTATSVILIEGDSPGIEKNVEGENLAYLPQQASHNDFIFSFTYEPMLFLLMASATAHILLFYILKVQPVGAGNPISRP